ncbi:hypothetical protein OSTOST_03871 [Ostertagia ostertagi]
MGDVKAVSKAEMRRPRVSEGGSPTAPRSDKACPPALSSGKGGMSGGSMQKTFQEAMRQRRTSLPANSLTFGKAQPLSIHAINDFGLPCVVQNPYSGEQLIVSNSCLKGLFALLDFELAAPPFTLCDSSTHAIFSIHGLSQRDIGHSLRFMRDIAQTSRHEYF